DPDGFGRTGSCRTAPRRKYWPGTCSGCPSSPTLIAISGQVPVVDGKVDLRPTARLLVPDYIAKTIELDVAHLVELGAGGVAAGKGEILLVAGDALRRIDGRSLAPGQGSQPARE